MEGKKIKNKGSKLVKKGPVVKNYHTPLRDELEQLVYGEIVEPSLREDANILLSELENLEGIKNLAKHKGGVRVYQVQDKDLKSIKERPYDFLREVKKQFDYDKSVNKDLLIEGGAPFNPAQRAELDAFFNR